MSMKSPTKFLHVTQIIFYIWTYDQSLVTLAFLGILNGFDQKKKQLFEGLTIWLTILD